MPSDETKRAAQEFLAERLSEENQRREEALNQEAALRLAPGVWKHLAATIAAQCKAWNEILGEEAIAYKETILGDLRIRCAGKSHQIVFHFDSRKLEVKLHNSARPENETDSTFFIRGYSGGTEAHLTRNREPINVEAVVLGELRVLAGIGRTAAQ